MAINPDAVLDGHFAFADAELPIAAICERDTGTPAILAQPRLDIGAKVEADGIGDLATFALAAIRHEQVFTAQLGAVVAQDQDAAMDQTIPQAIAIVAGLQPGRPQARPS